MTYMNPARARGLVDTVRAEGAKPVGTPEEIHAALMKTVAEFRQKHEEELKGIAARFDDVVTKEQVDRINGDLSNLQKALEEANKQIARAAIASTLGATPQDPAEREHFAAFNKYFTRGVEAGLKDLEVKAMTTTQSDPDGGYFVPHTIEQGIDQILRTVSVFRQLSSSTTIAGQTWSKFVNLGGATYGWVGEEETGTDRPETTTPKLSEIRLDVHEMYAMPASTQIMLDDAAFDVAGWLADEVQQSFADAENAAFLNGDGHKKPRGLLTYDWVDNASWAWGKFGFVESGATGGFTAVSASANPADDLIDLHGSLKQQARASAVWLMNDKTMHRIRKFKDNDGSYIWAPPSSAAAVPTILAKPVYTDDNMPDVEAGKIPILFGDFARTYRIINRQGIRVMRDALTQKGKVLFYTTKRIGGGAIHFQYMKGLKIKS